MKKILLLLTFLFNFSFSDNLCTENVIRFAQYIDSSWFDKKELYCSVYGYKPVMQTNGYWYCYKPSVNEFWIPDDQTCPNQKNSSTVDTWGIATLTTDGEIVHTPNPDPLRDGGQCRDLFQKDGVAYTCNPNTNEATPIENSDGVIMDDEGKDIPNCNDGYEYTSSMTVSGSSGTGYTSWGCSPSSVPETGGSGDGDSGSYTPEVTTNPDGSKSWTLPDGTNLNLTTNGTLTTTYSDGSTSVKQVGNDYTPGSTGGSGTSTGGGGGTNGNTTNEDNTSSNNDTPVDETPVANSCNDSSLTLQEKMMCEMNAGIKKLNSEATPDNSLNNLLKDLNKDNNTNLTAINTNIKDTKALNENQLAELKKITSELKNLNNSDGTSSSTQPITDNFTPDPNAPDVDNPISNNLIDSFLGIYSDFNTNISQKVGTLNNLISSSSNTISQGFNFSLLQTEIINCPKDFQLDLSSLGQGQKNMTIDFCQYTSQLKPFVYPILLITMSLGVIFFAFRFIGVLL